MISPDYRARVDLLLRVLPEIGTEHVFALKGGTAINLFVRDMPRLSVDIDLTYLPINPRAEALRDISEALHRINSKLARAIPDATTRVVQQSGGQEAKLTCRNAGANITIEVNTVMRGHLWPVRQLQLVKQTQDEFNRFAAATVISHPELFGGKICAALDRQHPRDLFDVHKLYENEGLTDDVRLGLVAALLSHTRPMHELLRPGRLDMRTTFDTQFAGMTLEPFSYDQFEAVRERLIADVLALLHDSDRTLLLSVKRGEPDWSLFPIGTLPDLPAVQWKLANIRKLQSDASKHAAQLRALEDALTA